MKPKYLVVCIDDDEHFIDSLVRFLPNKVAALYPEFECSFEFVTSVEELNAILPASDDSPPLAVLISDQVMPGITGIEVIEKVKVDHPDILCVLLTGNVAADSVKYAVNRHLLDQYVSKPIEDIDIFVTIVASLLKRYHICREEHERTEQLALTVIQLRELNAKVKMMLTTTEQIILLAKDLKSLEFNQVAEIGIQGAAKIFRAKQCSLCLSPEQGAQPAVYKNQCICEKPDFLSIIDGSQTGRDDSIIIADKTGFAQCPDCRPPGILIPLAMRCGLGNNGKEDANQYGCLCLCDVDPEVMAEPNLLRQNASLLRDILTASLDNARLYQQIKSDSETDYGTGIKTRRFFEEVLNIEYERSLRYGHTFCVIIIDVDKFKDVNDKHGHSKGDDILRMVADLICREKRSSDVPARCGGDEFVVLLPQTDLRGAMNLAERIRQRVESTLVFDDHKITISSGVTEWSASPNGPCLADVLRRADEAMYQAKRDGRNCVRTVAAAGAELALIPGGEPRR